MSWKPNTVQWCVMWTAALACISVLNAQAIRAALTWGDWQKDLWLCHPNRRALSIVLLAGLLKLRTTHQLTVAEVMEREAAK